MKTNLTPMKLVLLLLVVSMLFWTCKKKKNAWDGLKIGDEFEGGYIGYFIRDGDPGSDKKTIHGFVFSKTDLADTLAWSNNYAYVGHTDWVLFTGQLNTFNIITNQGNGNYAAKACADLEINGYSDWYLPSRVEFEKVREAANSSMNFMEGIYWTSTENEDSTKAVAVDWEFGDGLAINKKHYAHIRPIRTF